MEDKRQKIMKAALDVFMRRGFEAATIDEVAVRAGIAKGTVYLYFKDKVDLYCTQLEERILDLSKGLAAIATSNNPPIKKLEAMVVHNLDFIAHRYPGSHFISDTRAGQDPAVLKAIRTRITPRLSMTIGTFARVIQEGIARKQFRKVDPFATAAQIFALANISLMIRALDRKAFDPTRESRAILDIIINGIGRK
jgi:AcrR family transcriptional regulator